MQLYSPTVRTLRTTGDFTRDSRLMTPRRLTLETQNRFKIETQSRVADVHRQVNKKQEPQAFLLCPKQASKQTNKHSAIPTVLAPAPADYHYHEFPSTIPSSADVASVFESSRTRSPGIPRYLLDVYGTLSVGSWPESLWNHVNRAPY